MLLRVISPLLSIVANMVIEHKSGTVCKFPLHLSILDLTANLLCPNGVGHLMITAATDVISAQGIWKEAHGIVSFFGWVGRVGSSDLYKPYDLDM